ncbi:hypothetical protein ABT095_34540 [Kitasatospora sp. NPDC002227]|uniref:hypothetical protein n=1 Tax=Kitasatospora sp. NPDC002227 TaxID=3154773 RepID=UPI00332C2706
MSTPTGQLVRRIADLERIVAELARSSRLSHSSVDDGALTVTSDGRLRAVIGQQPDGTTAVTIVNGPPPPPPTTPSALPALGGVAVTWDGGFLDGQVCPLDFARVEVHAGLTADITPSPATLVATIESPQGGRVLVPTSVPITALLVARSTSGKASASSGKASAGPAKVVADEVLAGIIGELQLADKAVTEAKVAAGAIDSAAITDAAVTATKIGQAAVVAGKLAADSVTPGTVAADTITARELTAGSVTTAELAAGAVTTDRLAAGAVTAGQITAGTITAPLLAAGSVTATKIGANAVAAGKIAADAITGREIKALSVTADKIAVNSITAAQLAAGAITADVLAVGTVNNYIPDGSFEGPVGAALAAGGGPSWSIAQTGNGSARSLRVDATAPAATARSLTLATVPVRPGDQLLLRFDYQASVDWSGGAIKLYARWTDATGAVLAYNAAQTTTPVLGPTWQNLTATVTAPAGAVSAAIVAESWQATTGSVLFDNCETRPVLGQVQIADGTVTASKLSADAINGKTITGVTISGGTVTGGIVQTGISGARVVVNPDISSISGTKMPAVLLYTGMAAETSPGTIFAEPKAGRLQLKSPTFSGGTAYLDLNSPTSSGRGHIEMGTGDAYAPNVWIGGDSRNIQLTLYPADGNGATTYTLTDKALTVSAWKPVSLASGITQLGGWQTVSYRRMPDGTVSLRGIVSVPATLATGVLGTIPDPACRPKMGELFAVATSKAVGAQLFINPNGNIELWGSTAPVGGWVSFGSTHWSCID